MFTSEEKNALLQFMGQIYGQTHKLDQGIIGESQYLKPASVDIKRKFEEVLRTPTVEAGSQPQPISQPLPQEPLYQPPMELPYTPVVAHTQPEVQMQVPTSGELVQVLRDINLNLERIGNILEGKQKQQNVRIKKTKSTVKE